MTLASAYQHGPSSHSFFSQLFKFSKTTNKETPKIQCDELTQPWPQEYHTSLCSRPHCVGGWGREWVMTRVSPSAPAWPGKRGINSCVGSTSPSELDGRTGRHCICPALSNTRSVPDMCQGPSGPPARH